jgi:signal transduction histidine kinase
LDSAYILADRHGISQAIGNIIDNAIKYTDEGGVSLSLNLKSDRYILKVRDTGIGMSKEYMDRMFEAFSQESEGYTKTYQGIGLGMAIAKHHLDKNKAKIKVESAKGAGTVFTITFSPLKKHYQDNGITKKQLT